MIKKWVGLLVILTLLVTATGCFPLGAIVGRGPEETQSFEFSGFTRVNVASAFEVDITRSEEFSLSVTTNENLFEYLDLKRSGDTLWIQLRPGSYSFASLEAKITMPDLFSVNISGASTGKISGFNFSHSLELNASGASSIELADVNSGNTQMVISGASKLNGNLNAGDTHFNISGASSAELTGQSGIMELTGSGASSIELRDFSATNAEVNLSGATSGTIYASGKLDVQLSGASSLRYYGNPTLGDVNVSSGSSINQD